MSPLAELQEEQEGDGEGGGNGVATVAGTSPTVAGGAPKRGRGPWLRKRGGGTMAGVVGVPALLPSTSGPPGSRLERGRFPPLAKAAETKRGGGVGGGG